MNQIAPYDPSAPGAGGFLASPGGRNVLDWQGVPRDNGAGAALRQYWRVLLKRRKLILAAIAFALCIGVAAALLVKPMYAASSTIEIAREAASVVDMSDAQPVKANDPEFYQTQYSLLESRSLAEKVVDDLRLARDEDFLTNYGSASPEDLPENRDARREMATNMVMDGTEIVPVRLSSIVNVRYKSARPETAAKVANSLAQNYIDSNLERKYEASSYARGFLQKRLSEIRSRLEKSEREAVAYAGRNQLIDITPTDQSANAANQPQQSLVGATLAEANSALAQARATRIAAENAYRQAAAQPVEALANPALNQLRGQRAELSAQYSKMLSDFGPQYPTALALKAQIAELDRQI
ncbi:MAG: GumC family protein, partial [Tsuneonella sp.]